MEIYNLLRKCVKYKKFSNKNKFNICLYKILLLLFLIINIAYAKLAFINLKQKTNLTKQLEQNRLDKQSSLMFKLPTYLIDQDFINAKYVDIKKPLKAIMNDQHFSLSTKLKVFLYS